MRQGDFEAAWQISEKTLKTSLPNDLPRHVQSVWRGSPLAGKRVLIRCYRGLGDTIQFIRYAPQVKRIASEVIASAPAELIPLLRTMPAIDRLLELDHEGSGWSFDVEVEVTELPYVFRTTLDSIPADVPYFTIKPVSIRPTAELAVGIVWEAGDWDPRRSIPAALLDRLADISGVRFFSFQRGRQTGGTPRFSMIDLRWRDILHEAGMLLGIDLLVSVDTMPAHLAGALGVPVWLLVHADPDWRWMQDREDSPWYPSMRLFRQTHPGDWRPVVERVVAELRELSVIRQTGKRGEYSLDERPRCEARSNRGSECLQK